MGQRDRLYASENVLIGPVGFYASVPAAQAHVDHFLRRTWWRKHSPVRFVTLQYPAKGMSGATRVDEKHWQIDFGYTSLNDLSVAHELTHVLVGVTRATTPAAHERDHNARFAGAELAVVKHFIGAWVSERLREQFDANEVKWTPFE